MVFAKPFRLGISHKQVVPSTKDGERSMQWIVPCRAPDACSSSSVAPCHRDTDEHISKRLTAPCVSDSQLKQQAWSVELPTGGRLIFAPPGVVRYLDSVSTSSLYKNRSKGSSSLRTTGQFCKPLTTGGTRRGCTCPAWLEASNISFVAWSPATREDPEGRKLGLAKARSERA